jgi:hypothetical protein
VRCDLEHVWSGRAADKERKRIEMTEEELTKLQAGLDQGRFDNDLLNDVVDSIRKLSNDDERLPSRGRRVLVADDVSRRKDYQDHHEQVALGGPPATDFTQFSNGLGRQIRPTRRPLPGIS